MNLDVAFNNKLLQSVAYDLTNFDQSWLDESSRIIFNKIIDHKAKYGNLPSDKVVCEDYGLEILPDSEIEETLFFYAEKLKTRSMCNSLESTLKASALHISENDPMEGISKLKKGLLKIEESFIQDDESTEDLSSPESIEDSKEEYKKIKEGGDNGITGIRSPWPALDLTTGGWKDGELICFSARLGVGKCVAGKSWVYDPETGLRITVKDLVLNQRKVFTMGSNGGLLIKNPSHWISTGKKECLLIKTENGKEISVTPEHPMLTRSGYIEAKDLKVGGHVAGVAKIPFVNQCTRPDVYSKHYILITECIKIAKGKSSSTKIPNMVFSLPETYMAEFIQIFCAAIIPKNTNKFDIVHESRELLEGISDILLRFGLVCRISKISEMYRIRFAKAFIYAGMEFLLCENPRSEVEEVIEEGWTNSRDIYFDSIISIEQDGVQDVYDLTIPTHHNFIANGLVCHNTFALSIVAAEARRQNSKILFITKEMPPKQIRARQHAIGAKISLSDYRTGSLSKDSEDNLVNYLDGENNGPEFIIPSNSVVSTIFDVDQLIEKHRPDLVMVDGLYLLAASKEWTDIGQTSTNAKQLALKHDVPVIFTHQQNRGTNKKAGGATDKDLSYSDAIGQDADWIFGLSQSDNMRADQEMVLHTIKARESLPIRLTISWDLDKMNFGVMDVEGGVEMPDKQEVNADFANAEDTSTKVESDNPDDKLVWD